MIGNPISIMIPSGHRNEMPDIFQRIAKGERIEQFETVQRTKQGRLIHVSLTISPVRDSLGRIVGASKIARDITAQVLAAGRLAQLNADLQRSNEELARSNEDLERFAFVASHDLQEPLRMIAVYSQLLIKTYPAEIAGQVSLYVGNIVEGTKRMRELLADLRDYTEIGAPLEEPLEIIDLEQVMDTVARNLQAAISDSGAIITRSPLPVLDANSTDFISLFQNLVGNAIKYRRIEPPRIHISAEHTGRQLQFTVSDNGIGIEAEYYEKIFVPFKRLHGKQIPGTGIGLAICQRVVERYGGRIRVESEPGRGSSFIFTLPGTIISPPGTIPSRKRV
jgi:light-regulated signal transduction histidine kinase (bacteriophytochrome)